MSKAKLANTLKMLSNMANQGLVFTSVGLVSAFDPSTYQVQVLLHAQTADSPASQTGWIPLTSPWCGNGWGLFSPASQGDLILVFYQDGSLQNPIAGMRLFYDNQQPLSVNSGEFWLVHKSGSFLKFTNDGNVSISSSSEINMNAPTINLNATSEINITAPTVNAGAQGGSFVPLVKATSGITVNLKAT